MWTLNDQTETAEPYLHTDPMILQEVEAAWRALPGAHRIPDRTALDPATLGAAIEDCMVLEQIGPGIARIRVAGAHIREVFGTEPRGVPLSFVMAPEARPEMAHLLDDCFNRGCLIEVPMLSKGRFGQPTLTGRLLLLPLRDGFGHVTRALAVLALSGTKGKGGRRFTFGAPEDRRIEQIGHPSELQKAKPLSGLRLVVDNT